MFGTDVAPVDIHDDGALADWYLETSASQLDEFDDEPVDDGPDTTAMRALWASIAANHVLFDDPPEAWAAVGRMREAGFDDERALNQLSVMVAVHVTAIMERGDPTDDEAALDPVPEMTDLYARLPLPSVDEICDALERAIADEPGIDTVEAIAATLRLLGAGAEAPVVAGSLEMALDHLIEHGELAMTVDDGLVHARTAAAESTLTHRINEAEIEIEALSFLASDLALFGCFAEPVLADGTDLGVFSVEEGHLGWSGPDGWLADYEPDQLLAVRCDLDGVVTIEVIDDVAPDEATVRRFGQEFAREAEATAEPVLVTDIAVAMYASDRSAFAEPRAPLTEIAAACGLEQRTGWVADNDARWSTQQTFRRRRRLLGQSDDTAAVDKTMELLDRLEWTDLDLEAPEALRDLLDSEVRRLTLDELLGPGLEWGEPDDAVRITDALLAAARSPRHRAIANYMSGIVAERLGDPITADERFRAGHAADPDDGALVDVNAWYAFDRGDAATAARLWSMLAEPDPSELSMARSQAAAATPAASTGRNDPCWCGSGRKFKKCHLGAPASVPLPDRVGWLCRKATSWIERSDRYWDVLNEAVVTSTVDHPDPSVFADDPLIVDVVLTEEGGFATFLRHRGPLLPDDERLLAESWLLAERSVHEVVETAPGEGLVLRDLRTGDTADVRDRSLSASTQQGQMLCARVVPDGVGHQIIGGVVPVAPGQESDVIALCDDGDGFGLLAWEGARRRRPTLSNREGERTGSFVVEADVGDPAQARRALDELYGPRGTDTDDDEAWAELHELNADERVVRATLTLEASRLVAYANSRERIDRVIDALRGAIDGLVIVRNEGTVLDLGAAPTGGSSSAASLPGLSATSGSGGPGPDGALSPAELPEDVRTMIQERLEHNWLTEPVPALGGWTPTDAAADPTRREQVRRLIDSFEGPDDEAFGLRPDVLRRTLGL